ncbi:bifunctional phosphopantothenoylcysteine decarboxylase/phosphopantothenate--cysteine ligase CoaBC [Actinobacteria bacterium IMCC26103]|nr:bifunctional phosphopantothenoylcysteine decarboxylase/phosphopantothenate--cysteine ligase CoaBC [Actinobacteria bacterium IMCC26103]
MAKVREVILGVGGGIAAYKSCDLLRRLQERGYQVTVVPTPSSLNFVGAATWEALSGRAVTTQVWERVDEVRHISLANTADALIIAPATADLIARIAAGRADDLLTNLVLAIDVPILIVPAMHPQMWNDPATQSNVATLQSRGFSVMEPAIGRLTGSDIGQGRFPETNEIITKFEEVTEIEKDYFGKRVLITAGGTREAIDPVRYIGNRSSGRQGAAVARAARDRGAQVKMIFANAQLSPDEINDLSGIEIVSVETATEMFTALEEAFPKSDLLVMSAAVADARPSQYSEGKIKKGELRDIALVENPDLLKSIAKLRTKQIVVAFAAETNNDLAAAQAKMEAKGANILYLNNVSNGAIFGSLDTEGFIITSNGAPIPVPLTSKDTLAELLLDQALNQLG